MNLEKQLSVDLAFFLPTLNGGGAERVMLGLAGRAARAGYNVDLVIASVKGAFAGDVPPGVRLVDLKSRRVRSSILRLAHYIRRHKPPVLVSTLSHANVAAVWAKRLSKSSTRVVLREANVISYEPQESSLTNRLIRRFIRRSYKKADVVIAVSQDVRKDLIVLGVPEEKIQVIGNPVDVENLLEQSRLDPGHPWLQSGETPVILSVGRLTFQKDFDTLIKAFYHVLQMRDARLIILGEGEDRKNLQELAHSLKITEYVDMPGFVKNPYAFMARCTVYVQSSRWEGDPNALKEAMALGCPVVVTDCPGGHHDSPLGRQAKVIPVGDSRTLGDSILGVLSQDLPHHSTNVSETEGYNKPFSRYLQLFATAD